MLEVNGEFGYVVVEPGARWFDIHEAIRASGHRYMLSIPDLGWGGAVGNALDNGISYLPIGKNEQPICGMEVVLADGSLLRTGTGAVPGSQTWHLHRRGLGPTLDPLFTQSNFGIVTRMGMWLMPLPEVFVSLQMKLWNKTDIGPAVDIIRDLRLKGTLDGVPTLGTSLTVAAMATQRKNWTDDPTPIGDELREHIGREMGIGYWTGRLGLWGDEDIVDLNLAKVRRAFEAVPGAEIVAKKYTAEQLWSGDVPEHDQVQAGIPNMFTSNFMNWYSETNGAHWSVSPIVPLNGESFVEVSELLRTAIEAAGFDYFDGCMVNSDRSLAMVGTICFDRDNPEHVKNVREVAHQLTAELGKRGFGEYRAHTDVMEAATAQYNWNGHAYRRFIERIKDAVDPQGILNPGRYGIWPLALRSDRS